ncbi:hypothetical protein [Desulfosudis oleivorans]|uniref:hypothetical protein n=1 Tax=Desulfosudis oleivorans TaxID=181663 RepID=UPI0038CC0B07
MGDLLSLFGEFHEGLAGRVLGIAPGRVAHHHHQPGGAGPVVKTFQQAGHGQAVRLCRCHALLRCPFALTAGRFSGIMNP